MSTRQNVMLLILLVVFPTMFFVSCGEDGKSGSEALIIMSDEEPGENCVVGGTRVDTGLDMNGNKDLDEDEITDTRYVCDGEDGTEGLDGEKGNLGEDGDDGATGATGEQGDPGVDDVCAGNTAPVINSININNMEYDGNSGTGPLSTAFPVEINVNDGDGDILTYSILGSYVDIVDNGSGSYVFTGDTEGVFHFTVFVSDGCQMVLKKLSVVIDKYAVIYSGPNRNITYDKYNTYLETISLFDGVGTWDDMRLSLHIFEDPESMNQYSFGNMLQIHGNYVEFAVGSSSSDIKNFSLGEEISSSHTYSGNSYKDFSDYYEDFDMGFINENGEFRNSAGYAGLKFTDGTDVYYGWIQVSVTDYNNSNIEGTLIDWAYSPLPDNPILAGDKNE